MTKLHNFGFLGIFLNSMVIIILLRIKNILWRNIQRRTGISIHACWHFYISRENFFHHILDWVSSCTGMIRLHIHLLLTWVFHPYTSTWKQVNVQEYVVVLRRGTNFASLEFLIGTETDTISSYREWDWHNRWFHCISVIKIFF